MCGVICHIISGSLVLRIVVEDTLLVHIDTGTHPVAINLLIGVDLSHHAAETAIVDANKSLRAVRMIEL